MRNFTIDKRHHCIALYFKPATEFDEIWDWCYNRSNDYECYANGIVYKTEQALTLFLLRWI